MPKNLSLIPPLKARLAPAMSIARIIVLTSFLIFFLTAAGSAGVYNVKKWGAKGDGITDDSKAIQAAVDAASPGSFNVIYFPRGTYLFRSFTVTSNYLENYFIRVHNNLQFKGDGTSSVLRLAPNLFNKSDSMANAHMFYGRYISNILFSNLLIDMNGKNNLVPENTIKNNSAIFIYHGNSLSLTNLTIKNCSGRNMVIIKGDGTNAKIKKSIFLNGGHYVGVTERNKYQTDFSFLYSEWDSTIIENNHIEQQDVETALCSYTGGIEIHGSYSKAADNKIIGCYPGVYISSSWHATEKTSVENNRMLQCVKGVSFWVNYPMNNITICDNIIELTYARKTKPNVLTGIDIPNGNSEVYSFQKANNAALSNIKITGNKIAAIIPDSLTDKTAGMILHSLQNSVISRNTITGMNYAGVMLQGSKWGMDSLTVTANQFTAFKPNKDQAGVGGYIVITDTYSSRKDRLGAPGLKRIHFTGNDFIKGIKQSNDGMAAKPAGKFFGAFIALPGKMHQQIHFNKNNFSDAGEKINFVKTD
jgi:hypothetical protein